MRAASVEALVGGPDADIGLRRQEFQAGAGGLQMISLDLRRVIANRDFQIASALGIDGGDRRLRSHLRLRAKVKLYTGEQADGGGPEELYARPAKRYTIGLEGETGIITVDGVGGDSDLVIDFVR